MKISLNVVLFVLIFYQPVHAQFQAGISGSVVYPLKTLAAEVDYGYGPSVLFGYSFFSSFDVQFGYERLFFGPLRPDYYIGSGNIVLRYRFLNKQKYSLYSGFLTGLFQIVSEVPWIVSGDNVAFQKKKEHAVGIAPMVGLITDSGLHENLKIDVSTSYSLLFLQRNYAWQNLKLTAVWYF
jgi:hypothetical protein